MMIKCTKCGFENQMGSIFCRGCGEKIDMNAMDPETLAKNQKKGDGKKFWKILDKFILIVTLLALIAVFGAAFTSYGLAPYKGVPAAALKTAENKISRIGAEKVNWILPTTRFTMDEVNSLLKNRLFAKAETAEVKADAKTDAKADAKAKKDAPKDAKKEEAAAAQPAAETSKTATILDNLKKKFEIDNVMVTAAGSNMTVVIYSTAFGYVPLRFEVTGMIQPGEKLPVNFTVEGGKINYLPLPGALCEKTVVTKLAPFFNNGELERILSRATSIKMDDQELEFKFEKKENAEVKR